MVVVNTVVHLVEECVLVLTTWVDDRTNLHLILDKLEDNTLLSDNCDDILVRINLNCL